MSCFNVDHTSNGEFRGYIRSILVKNFDDFKESILAICDYFWKELQCDSVRVDQHHFEVDGKLNADKTVKDTLTMERKGFKWKSIVNYSDGTRA